MKWQTFVLYTHEKKVNRITTTSSFSLNAITLKILGKELNPKNATSNIPRVPSLDDDDINLTKPYDTVTETNKI